MELETDWVDWWALLAAAAVKASPWLAEFMATLPPIYAVRIGIVKRAKVDALKVAFWKSEVMMPYPTSLISLTREILAVP